MEKLEPSSSQPSTQNVSQQNHQLGSRFVILINITTSLYYINADAFSVSLLLLMIAFVKNAINACLSRQFALV